MPPWGGKADLPNPNLLTLEKRIEKGSPVISYVLGVLAARDKDYKLAMRRLEKALALGTAMLVRPRRCIWTRSSAWDTRAQPNKAGCAMCRAQRKCPPEM
jgi:uncharacterized protein HemY